MQWKQALTISSLILMTVFWLQYSKMQQLNYSIKTIRLTTYSYKTGQRSGSTGSSVLIFAYMRGGSTLIGELLGHREETMYFYEPLNKMSEFHFSTRFKKCSLKRKQCKANVTYSNMMTNIVNSLFTCDINVKLWQSLPVKLMKYKGGENWKNIDIKDNDKSRQKILTMCKMSEIRVSKVLRLGMDVIEDIIVKIPGIKIIFLIRDPRAIIHSRKNVNFIGDNTGDTFKLASSLCSKMEFDFVIKSRLETKYPNTFYTLKYEEYTKSNFLSTYQLFRFLGQQENNVSIHLNKFDGNRSEERPCNTKRRDAYKTANKWRETIDFNEFMIIDEICKAVVEKLGYVRVQNVNDLRNISLTLVSRK